MDTNKDKSIIVQKDDPVLRKKAVEVPLKKIKTKEMNKIISLMKTALATQKDGIAIAAPQIGESIRLFIVSDNILKQADPEYKGIGKDLIFFNPEIMRLSREKNDTEEGCLSVRWKYGKVKRSTKITIKGYNEDGELIERGASGLLAQVFQHEIDHLNGILFIDKAYDVQDIPPENLDEIGKVV